jgi:hypothetical protein
MKKKSKKTFHGPVLHDCKLVPITDPDEIAALDSRIKEAEKRLANVPEINGCKWTTGGVSYTQLDKVLRSLGFTCKEVQLREKARLYEHQPTGARFAFPAIPLTDGVADCRLDGVRASLELYGLAEPKEFDAKLKKAKKAKKAKS